MLVAQRLEVSINNGKKLGQINFYIETKYVTHSGKTGQVPVFKKKKNNN